MSEYYLAIDIGASSGRHMLGLIEVFAGMLMHYFMRSKKVLKNAKN